MSADSPLWFRLLTDFGPLIVAFGLILAVFEGIGPYVTPVLGETTAYLVLFAIWAAFYLLAVVALGIPINRYEQRLKNGA